MTWEREYFRLAAWVLACKLKQQGGMIEYSFGFSVAGGRNWEVALLNDGTSRGAAHGEMDYGAEMGKVLQEARRTSAISLLKSSIR